MYLSSCCMYFSPPSKSRPNESRRFWTMLNIGLICKTPFMSPVAEIENDASYWTELLNWIGLVLYHLIYAGTSNCSNQDIKLLLLEFCYTYPSQWWPCKNWPSKTQKEKHNQRHFEKCSHFIFTEICDFSKYFKSLVIKSVITKRKQLLVRTKNLNTCQPIITQSYYVKPILTLNQFWHDMHYL